AKAGKLDILKKIVFNTVMKSPLLMSMAAWAASISQRWFYTGNTFLEALVPRLTGMEDKHFPVMASTRSVSRWPTINPPVSGVRFMRVGYFIGCATNLMFTDIADATIRVLTLNNIEVVIPGRQACCGIPVYSSGDFKAAKSMAKHNLRVFSRLDVDCIVTDCSSCSAALKHDVTELLDVRPFGVPVYDLTEFLVNVVDIDRDFGKVPVKTTWHDPCHLRRGQGIYEEPRELLRMVPGVEFGEME
ncbi:unnamed protein product, partial [marine sediment metagenome]